MFQSADYYVLGKFCRILLMSIIQPFGQRFVKRQGREDRKARGGQASECLSKTRGHGFLGVNPVHLNKRSLIKLISKRPERVRHETSPIVVSPTREYLRVLPAWNSKSKIELGERCSWSKSCPGWPTQLFPVAEQTLACAWSLPWYLISIIRHC